LSDNCNKRNITQKDIIYSKGEKVT